MTLFTSESVSAGHPDKLCDQISDAILDAHLAQDPFARVAVETGIKDQFVFVLGEITSTTTVDTDTVVRETLRRLHPDTRWGVNVDALTIALHLSQQSPDIAQGVDGASLGAGDQGLMFGYACDQTPSLMPLPITLAHRLVHEHAKQLPNALLGPDAKTQVTISYENHPTVHTVVVSSQHSPEIPLHQVRELLMETVVKPGLGDWYHPDIIMHLNPAGTFHLGGPVADAGVTGRKIIVDTYGGYARHGGGAFSGKDGTKVDRAAAYGARQLAKDVVARGWASACEVQVSYAIGFHQPVSITFTTPTAAPILDMYADIGINPMELMQPSSLIERLALRSPVFLQTASGGHFGRDFSWEKPLA